VAAAVREFGQRGLDRIRVDANNMSSIENGAVPLRDLLMEQQGEPMSGVDQLSLMSALFLPAAALPAAAVQIGMRSAQIANFLRAGPKGVKALRQIILERQAAAKLPKPHRQFGSTGAARQTLARRGTEYDPKMAGPGDPMAMARGGKIRQSILNRYGRMI
jgi:hypothetical protein